MNLTREQVEVEKFLNGGIVLDTSDLYKYKKHGGALMPNLIDSEIIKIPMGVVPMSLVPSNKLSATVYNPQEPGAAEQSRPVQFTCDSDYSEVGIKIDGQFSMYDINVKGLNALQSRLIKMMDEIRMRFDHLCIQNLVGQMPETLDNEGIEDEFGEFNFGAIEKGSYRVAKGVKPLPLTQYIPVNATYPWYQDGPAANTLAAEGLTVGKIALAASNLSKIPGARILIVPQRYMTDLAKDKNVMKLQSTISAPFDMSPDIVSYTSLLNVYVIGIPDEHFPPELGNGKAHWVNNDNGGGNVEMLTTKHAIEKDVKVDYGIMFMAGGKSFEIVEEINPTTPSCDVAGNNGMKTGIQEYDGQNLPNRIVPLFNPIGVGATGIQVRLELIYWFSRPVDDNIVVIELNPGQEKINENPE